VSAAFSMTLEQLSLREKLAQLLYVRIGSNLPPVRTVEEDADRVLKLLAEYPLGGLLLFNGQREQTPATLEKLQAASQYPLLIGADIERGVGQQIRGYTLFPHAMAFDALGDNAPQQVYEFARLTGIAARAHGIHMNFSPVADVNIDPQNPIIATRAFGNDPERVAELVTAFARGAQAGGILVSAKHFPGHGNTHEDSHHALPTVQGNRDELAACELVPFKAAIAAGIPLLMTAHVSYPGWDDSGDPATLSKPILTDLLRGELKFQGSVVSDSLLMEGVKARFDNEGDLVLHTLLAGVDLQLDVMDPGVVLAAQEKAVADGRLPMARVDEACARVLALKQNIFGRNETVLSDKALTQTLDQSEKLAKAVARQSIHALDQKKQLTPLATDRSLFVAMLRPHQSHLDPAELPLRGFLAERFSKCEYQELGPQATAEDYSQALKKALETEQVVIAMVVKPAAWYRFGLLAEQDQYVRALTAQRDCLLVSLGSPVALENYTDAAERVCAYSDVFVSQAALAEFLSGQ
jgi:beta-glucosidase-like glycosyl hydrolase